MDLCSWAAPALMERRRAGREEWKKRRGEEKVKHRRRKGVEGARFPRQAASFLSAQQHTCQHPHEHAGVHKHTHTHTLAQTEPADKANRKPQTADRISKGLVN